MIDIKKETIAKYVRILANLGCQFKVIEADGTEHGELVVAKKPSKPRISVLAQVDYKTPLLAMQPGDVISLSATADMPLESLRSCVSSFAAHTFGTGAVTTTVDRNDNTVVILRVE
jgi:hypothetical protein